MATSKVKKILYIDMDGVLADFDGKMAELHPGFENLEPLMRYHTVDKIVADNPTVFDDLELIEGAKTAVEVLYHFFDVYFLSTAMWECPESFTSKRKWIEKHFGKLATKRLILTHRKDLNIGDYLIDDRLRNGAAEFKGEHIHFGTEKFPNWLSVLAYLKDKM